MLKNYSCGFPPTRNGKNISIRKCNLCLDNLYESLWYGSTVLTLLIFNQLSIDSRNKSYRLFFITQSSGFIDQIGSLICFVLLGRNLRLSQLVSEGTNKLTQTNHFLRKLSRHVLSVRIGLSIYRNSNPCKYS